MTGTGVGVRRSAALAGVLAVAMLVRTEGAGTLPTYGPLVFQFGTQPGQPEESRAAQFNCDGKTDVVLIQHIFQSSNTLPDSDHR